MREADVVHGVLKTWGAHPALRIWRQNTGVGWFANGKPARKTDKGAYPVQFGEPGQGDIIGLIRVLGGRHLEIECKSDRGSQSPEQVIRERMILTMGGIYILARSLEQVDAAFAALGIYR